MDGEENLDSEGIGILAWLADGAKESGQKREAIL